MAHLSINVKRIEEHYEGKTVARILAYRKGNIIGFEVQSSSKLFKNHIEDILNAPYYSVMPGPESPMYYANHAEYFQPGTISYFTFLHDRLGWYGYITDVLNKKEVTKSIFFEHDEYDEDEIFYYDPVLLKSINWGDYTRQNKEGHTILVTVPPGYVAVSTGGKVIGPGKKVGRNGADLDKPDAKWRLVQNDDDQEGEVIGEAGEELRFLSNEDWESQYAQDPKKAENEALRQMVQMLNPKNKDAKYHPGMHKELYGDGAPGFVQVDTLYKNQFDEVFDAGIALQNILQDQVSGRANEEEIEEQEESLFREDVLIVSMDEDLEFIYTIPGPQFTKSTINDIKERRGKVPKNWAMFDVRDYLDWDDEKITRKRTKRLRKNKKINPALLPQAEESGATEFVASNVLPHLDLSGALPLIEELEQETITALPTPAGLNPTTTEDVQNMIAGIVKESEDALNKRRESLKRTPENVAKIDAFQKKEREVEAKYFYKDEKDNRQKPLDVTRRMGSIKGFTNGKGKEDVYFDFLPDDGTEQGLRLHQIYGVEMATMQERYAAYGGIEENDGYFWQWKPGVGKSLVIVAADAVMRNKGLFKGTHVIMAPRAVVPNWGRDLVNFRKKKENKDFFIIDGDRQKRQKQWERIQQLTEAGTPPQFVIIGAGKASFEAQSEEEEEEEEVNLEDSFDTTDEAKEKSNKKEKNSDMHDFSMDMKYLRELLIETGNLTAMTIDETGLFVNKNSRRHQVLRALVNLATSDTNSAGQKKKQRSIIWTLNGNIQGNSAADMISELGWVNAGARVNRDAITTQFTNKPQKNSDNVVWNEEKKGSNKIGLPTFMRNFGHSINRVDQMKATGTDTLDLSTEVLPTGEEYASVYEGALDKFIKISDNQDPEENLSGYRFGLMAIMLNASQNAAKPSRMVEYGLDDKLMEGMKQILRKNEWKEFQERIQEYRSQVSTFISSGDIGWLPKAKQRNQEGQVIEGSGYTAAERDDLFEQIVGRKYTDIIDNLTNGNSSTYTRKGRTITSWSNPIVELVVEKLEERIGKPKTLHERIKIGFQSQSRMIAEAVYKATGRIVGLDRQLLVGGTKQSEILKMQEEHAKKEGNPIISIMTGAATHGVNFASPLGFVTETYNPAKVEQGQYRFRRNIFDPVEIVRIGSSGIGAIVSEIAARKAAWASAAEKIDFSDDDAAEQVLKELMGTDVDKSKFLEKLLKHKLQVQKATK